MYSLIYNVSDKDELESEFKRCLMAYGHQPAAVKFIQGLEKVKEKVCRAHTQYIFSFNRTTTQQGEGFNNTFKGHADLKEMLSDADLYQCHQRLESVKRKADLNAKKMLVRLRKDEKRWSNLYHSEVKKSMELSSISVVGCEKVSDSVYNVTDINGGRFTVNLSTKIVHRGHVYTIPTCNCGYWHSCFRMCKHIIQPLTREKREVFDVHNVHPIYLNQLHPMWRHALQECKRDDYDDFPHLSGSTVRESQTKQAVSPEAMKVYVCPDQFFDQFGSAVNGVDERYSKLGEECELLKKLAVTEGNEDTFRHAHARVLQTINEVKEEIHRLNGLENITLSGSSMTILQAPTIPLKSRQQRVESDSKNKSRMNRKKPAGKKNAGGKKKAAVSVQGKKFCSQCYILHMNGGERIVFDNHDASECGRMDQFLLWQDVNIKRENPDHADVHPVEV